MEQPYTKTITKKTTNPRVNFRKKFFLNINRIGFNTGSNILNIFNKLYPQPI